MIIRDGIVAAPPGFFRVWWTRSHFVGDAAAAAIAAGEATQEDIDRNDAADELAKRGGSARRVPLEYINLAVDKANITRLTCMCSATKLF